MIILIKNNLFFLVSSRAFYHSNVQDDMGQQLSLCSGLTVVRSNDSQPAAHIQELQQQLCCSFS